jgi:hypothetical protein
LVVPGGVELEVSQERSAGRDDPDVLVVGEDEDGLSGVAAADSDVVQAPGVAEAGDAGYARVSSAGAQEGKDCQHPPVVLGRLAQVELEEDL